MQIRDRFIAALGVMLAIAPLSANAAEIKYQGDKDGIHYITLVGLLVDGDAARFNQMAIQWPDKSVVVGLAGPGGKLGEGLEIGNTIRVHSYTTIAAAECASACSLIWLAGTARYVLAGGSLGFHAAYVSDGASVHESVQANAIIGAYLANLGLSYDVVAYVTATASTEVTWLNAAEAKRLNIKYTFIQNEPSSSPVTPQSAPIIAAPVATVHPPAQTVNADAAKNAELDDRLNASELLLRKEVGDKKVDATIAYFRAAAAQDPSLFSKLRAQPDPYRWALRQVEEFQQQSIVLSSKDAAQTAAALTQAYASGREARVNYEQWFTALPAGNYQIGASFWASNRSLKMPPTCTNAAVPEWQKGCLDSRERLTLIDARRHTDPNYWWGWNSL